MTTYVILQTNEATNYKNLVLSRNYEKVFMTSSAVIAQEYLEELYSQTEGYGYTYQINKLVPQEAPL